MREDLGVTPAPKLTSGALSAVPVVVGLWPVLLGGLYFMSRRKDRIAKEEVENLVEQAVARAHAEAEKKMGKSLERAEKEKQVAVKTAVKKALEEAVAKHKKDMKEES
jgi:formate dehydrogenase iron-sulfur subunit